MAEMNTQDISKESKYPLEYKPEVFDEKDPVYLENFQYWQTERKLRIGIEVEWTASSSQPVIGTASRTSWEWTGTQSITWIWFTPKLVKIMAVRSASDWSGYMSVGSGTWPSNEFSFYVSPWASAWTWITDYSTTRIIYTANWRAELQSMDSDWFTLNWTTMSSNVTFGYECYP